MINDGHGAFPIISGSYASEGSSWGLFGADLDGDADIDLAVSNPDSGTIVIMRNSGDGNFPPELFGSYATNGSAWGLFASDLNGDGALDLAVANTDSNGVTELWNLPINFFYTPGDVNGFGGFTGLDVVYAVAYLKGGPEPLCSFECPPSSGYSWFLCGDVNNSCTFTGLDVTFMVAFLKGGPEPVSCGDCLPSR